LSFAESNSENTFSAITNAFNSLTPGAVLIAVISLAVLILWDRVLTKKHKIFQVIQGPIVVVVLGILMSYLYQSGTLNFSLAEDQMVRLPVANNLGEFFSQFTSRTFLQSAISRYGK
jgi:SulP family sulfate permease